MNVLRFLWPRRQGSKSRPNPRGAPPDFASLDQFDQYVSSADERRNALDLIPGWNHNLLSAAGADAPFSDPRLHWAIAQFGGVEGRRVLEIGPMEASHTVMLERAGAVVHAVEANKLAFLKCLIAKEILGLKASFSLAEANEWLRASAADYDLVVACGVLYHMRDPVTLLELLAGKADALYLWTHVVGHEELDWASVGYKPYYSVEQRLGLTIRLFARSYCNAPADPAFCGGVYEHPRWMLKDDILQVLAALGFDEINVAHEEPRHPNGSAMSVFARKTKP